MKPTELHEALKRQGITISALAARAGIHRVNLHQNLAGQVEPGIERWVRVVDAYYALLAEKVDREWAERQRRRDLLNAHPDLLRDLHLFAGPAVEAGACSEMYAAAALGLSFEEWNALQPPAGPPSTERAAPDSAALIASLSERLAAAEAENAGLRGALEWYADSRNWRSGRAGHLEDDPMPIGVLNHGIWMQDNGNRARQALAQKEGQG